MLVGGSAFLAGCQGLLQHAPSISLPQQDSARILMWKGSSSGIGLYSNETTLTPAIVNPTEFGRIGTFQADGIIMAQPLYVANVQIASGGSHNLIIIATENDSVYAFDADDPGAGPLWSRSYIDPSDGITTMPDNFGGRTTLGGQVGITGTPYIDSTTGAMYFVTVLEDNGTPQQWLRAISITSGQDYGAGSMQIQASVAGDGKASVDGRIPFDPSIQNQRAGLTEVPGAIVVPWASFSDYGVYHGWLMGFDPMTLQLLAVFNPTPQYQAVDAANGVADHGGGAGLWQGGAAPSVDADGNLYLDTADGSFNADEGGNNYGDTLLRLHFNGTSFQILDWFTPFNADCIDLYDLELGSGGVALLPTDFTNGVHLAAAYSKEGRLFLVNVDNLGHYNAAGDTQIPQQVMVGNYSCSDSINQSVADGPDWNRLYGNASYWNGNLYAAASNLQLKQYQFQNGILNPTPVAVSPSSYGYRGANTVVSSNGTQSAIVWAYEKTVGGLGILHAYDATNVGNELWNSNMSGGGDSLGEGIGFGTPVIADGRVIVTYDKTVGIYGPL
ncbi:MAG TPA: hypothetical protein VMB19_09035 [Silvibacterium sp.]|nr:hypothetical protein [Silvibacterium sp.]